jgi:hypothetical protein
MEHFQTFVPFQPIAERPSFSELGCHVNPSTGNVEALFVVRVVPDTSMRTGRFLLERLTNRVMDDFSKQYRSSRSASDVHHVEIEMWTDIQLAKDQCNLAVAMVLPSVPTSQIVALYDAVAERVRLEVANRLRELKLKL